MGSGVHRTGQEHGRPRGQPLVSRRGAKPRQRSAGRRGAGGVQPLGRHLHARRIDLRVGLLRQVRVRPAGVHPGPLRRIHGPAGRLAASSGGHRGESRKCRRRTAFGRGGAGLPGRRLRLLPADVEREHRRLQRAHRLRADRHRGRGADRADRLDRRPGDPAVPHPRQLAGPQAGTHQSPDGHSAGQLRLPVRPQRHLPAEPTAAVQDRHRGARADRHHRPVRRRTPTSTRSTHTCVR